MSLNQILAGRIIPDRLGCRFVPPLPSPLRLFSNRRSSSTTRLSSSSFLFFLLDIHTRLLSTSSRAGGGQEGTCRPYHWIQAVQGELSQSSGDARSTVGQSYRSTPSALQASFYTVGIQIRRFELDKGRFYTRLCIRESHSCGIRRGNFQGIGWQDDGRFSREGRGSVWKEMREVSL